MNYNAYTHYSNIVIYKMLITIHDLPIEILVYILSLLSLKDAVKCSRVCRLWKDLQHAYIKHVYLNGHTHDSIYDFLYRVNPKICIQWNRRFSDNTLWYDKLNPTKIIELELFNTSIYELVNNKTNIHAMNNLTRLVLHDMDKFSYIAKDGVFVLPKLPYLKFLEISMCDGFSSITNLPNELEYLILSNNQFTTYPSEIFNLTNLKYLDLRCNDIKYIDNFPPYLEYLSVNGNENIQLSNVPLNLKYLFIDYIRTECVPEYVYTLYNLRELNMSYNSISEIDARIQNLKHLTILNFEYNSIRFLPIEISTLSNLRTLSMGYNKIKNLPFEFIYLINLRNLDLEYNNLDTVPECIKYLKLNKLDLVGNYLEEIPEYLQDRFDYGHIHINL